MKVQRNFTIDLDVAQALEAKGGSASAEVNRALRVILFHMHEEPEEPEHKKAGRKAGKKDFRLHQAELSKRGASGPGPKKIVAGMLEAQREIDLEQGLQSLRKAFTPEKKLNAAQGRYMHNLIIKLCEENSLTGNELVSKAFGDEVPTQFKQFARLLAAGH